MRKLLWVLFAAGTLVGCKKEAASTSTPVRERVGVAEEGRREAPAEVLEELDDSKPYVLTQAKLDAYVGYQRRVLDAYAAMAKALQGAQASDAMKAIESKAEVESKARGEAGLSEEDVNRIGSVVMDVVTQRHMAAMLDLSGELQKLEAMQAKLKPAQQKELAPQLATMRQRLQETERLVSVRRTHGDANVDLVLTREHELMRNYQDMIRSFGGKTQ
jgi:hypothetical protein